MAKCGHCGKNVKGIRDHIRDVHGYPFYCLGPHFDEYYGKNDPPYRQTDDWPDRKMNASY